MKISDCGAVNLLAALFNENPNKYRVKFGLQTTDRFCIVCNHPLEQNQRKFCSRKCYHEYNNIEVSCSQCGRLFRRTKSLVINREHSFCSIECRNLYQGKKLGEIGTRHFRDVYLELQQLKEELAQLKKGAKK
jgi:hypothetical protein